MKIYRVVERMSKRSDPSRDSALKAIGPIHNNESNATQIDRGEIDGG
jgi:hypothetical protein